MGLSAGERAYLRDLGARVAEAAALPEQAEKAARWKRHNALEKGTPMILVFPEGSWEELVPPGTFRIGDPFFRGYERELLWRLYYHEHLRDDGVISGVVHAPAAFTVTPWGVEQRTTRPGEPRGACHYEAAMSEEDLEKLRAPEVALDGKATAENLEKVASVFEGVLAVEKRGVAGSWFAPLDMFATWRSFDKLFLDLIERPEWVHAVLEKITEGTIGLYRQYERLGLLSLNNGPDYVGSGGFGFTDELPGPGFDGRVRTTDLWGHATAQIFSLVSPEMHEEFALRYEKRFLALFGLCCYGCCEPLHKKLRHVLAIPRLRRVSMSPWVDVAEGAEQIGDRVIFSYKPNPAVVAGETWDPAAARAILRDVVEKTRGCVLEIVLKDTHTCRKDPRRMSEWVQAAREAVS